MNAVTDPATSPEPVRSSLRDRLRPLELLGLAAAFGVFAGLVTFFVLQEWNVDWADRWPLWPIVAVVAFIVGLVVLAMLALVGYEPPPAPDEHGVLGQGRKDQEPPAGH